MINSKLTISVTFAPRDQFPVVITKRSSGFITVIDLLSLILYKELFTEGFRFISNLSALIHRDNSNHQKRYGVLRYSC
jgi:hypothetical protein